MSLQLQVVTPQRQIIGLDGVNSVTLPGVEGELGILPNHIPLMTTLDSGVMLYDSKSGKKALAIHWGYAQVESNGVTVLAELAEKAEDIDADRASAALKKAQEALRGTFGSDEAEQKRLAKYEGKLKRALVRQAATRFK